MQSKDKHTWSRTHLGEEARRGILTKPRRQAIPQGFQKDYAIQARVDREIKAQSYRLRKLMRGRFIFFFMA